VAIAANGAATAIWGSNNGTQIAAHAPGASAWGSLTTLSATGDCGSEPQLALAPDGTLTAVWTSNNGFITQIQEATRPAGAAMWGLPAAISLPAQHATAPQLAVNPDGAVTVWSSM
jgi:hypothetical protein